jgi:hypothetical protein
VDGVFETQQSVALQWRDPRLRLQNLQEDTWQNSLLGEERAAVWTPVVTFLNTARQDRSISDNSSLVTVARQGTGRAAGRAQLRNVYFFRGDENPLEISRVYSTEWLCSYNMLWYPFDTQVQRVKVVDNLVRSDLPPGAGAGRGCQPPTAAGGGGSPLLWDQGADTVLHQVLQHTGQLQPQALGDGARWR